MLELEAVAPVPSEPLALVLPASPGWLRCAILNYKEPVDGAVEHTRVVVSIIDACPSLALAEGVLVEVEMSEHPADPTRLVDDLIDGNPLIAVPGCGPGSIIRFTGCTPPASPGEPMQASDFSIESPVMAPAEVVPA